MKRCGKKAGRRTVKAFAVIKPNGHILEMAMDKPQIHRTRKNAMAWTHWFPDANIVSCIITYEFRRKNDNH